MDDKTLRQHVEDELEFVPMVNSAHIGVAVSNGVVTLTGHVGSCAEKVAVDEAVRRVRGVRGVAEEIEVRYPNDKKRNDDQIAERALSIIRWDARIPANAVKVEVQKGVVTLSGALPWRFQSVAAEAAVRKLSGVVGVDNEIEISPTGGAVGIQAEIVRALSRKAELDPENIMVVAHDDRVTLIGTVGAWSQRELAERAAWSSPGVRSVENRLEIV